jgi:hypothetical protein
MTSGAPVTGRGAEGVTTTLSMREVKRKRCTTRRRQLHPKEEEKWDGPGGPIGWVGWVLERGLGWEEMRKEKG